MQKNQPVILTPHLALLSAREATNSSEVTSNTSDGIRIKEGEQFLLDTHTADDESANSSHADDA